MEGSHRVGPAARLDAVQRGRNVEEEAGGVVVFLVEGEPGGAELRILPRALVDPCAEQRGFAETGGGGNEGERPSLLLAFAQALDQAGAEDCMRPGRGHEQLRGQDGCGHGSSILRLAAQRIVRGLTRPRRRVGRGAGLFVLSAGMLYYTIQEETEK